MTDNITSPAQNYGASNFTNRFFVSTDDNNYVISMMVAINQDEADTYATQSLIEVTQDVFESIGQDSKYINGVVTKGLPRIPLMTEYNADAIKGGLLREATDRIQALQDAVDLEMATDEETAQLTAWRKYRVLLTRVDTSTAPDIDWPQAPTA